MSGTLCIGDQPVKQKWIEADALEEAAALQADAVLESESDSPLLSFLITWMLLEFSIA